MKKTHPLAKIDLHLVEVLRTLLVTRNVSRTAVRLGMHQPAVSASLRRLRELTGDPLLVRAGAGMAPTETGLALLEPARRILESAQLLLGNRPDHAFDPATAEEPLRIAASDYLDPFFLPNLVSALKRGAPHAPVEITPLSADMDYRQRLASGEIDLVIGNWLSPPGDLHQGKLIQDEIVCLVNKDHPGVRRGWNLERYLACEHVAPAALHPGALGVIDEHLKARALKRRITARCPYFGLLPSIVSQTLLVLTTGRLFCSRYLDRLPVKIVSCPVEFPPLKYYQLWHERVHQSGSGRWLRDTTRQVASRLRSL